MAKIIQLKNTNNEEYYPYAILKEFILYDNDTGNRDTITLSDSANNYKYIEIFYRNNDNQYSSVKVYKPNNKKISLISCFTTTEEKHYNMLKTAQIQIVGNKINKLGYCEGNISYDTTTNVWINNTYIVRVVGYK